MNKKIIPIIVTVLLLVVGSVTAAIFFLKKSPKEQYFLAEIDSAKYMVELFKDRYKEEFAWVDVAKEKPVQYEYDLSLQHDGQDEYAVMLNDVLNGLSATITLQQDPVENIVSADFKGSFMDVKLENFTGYATTEKLVIDLPFSDKYIQLKDNDFGKLMSNFDETYVGDEKLGLADILENRTLLTDEQSKYLLDEYVKHVYKELPDEAFTKESETVDVHGKSLKTDRITMNLSAKDAQNLVLKVLEKAKTDEKLKAILVDILKKSSGPEIDAAVAMIEEEFESAIDEAITELKGSEDVTGNIESVIWVADKHVVKRELKAKEADEEFVIVKGTQLLEKEQQVFAYEFSEGESALHLKGELSWKGGKASDKVSILSDAGEGLTYTGEETLTNGERKFERVITFEDEYDTFTFDWVGSSAYKNDSVVGDYSFGIATADFAGKLNIQEKAELIKKVEIPTDKESVDLGSMDATELEQYLYEDLLPSFEEWSYQFAEAFESLFY
ncbi:DUF6583 family protein [Solibacillus sp. CAU 1738]|uniref:DUF6583 family protein n=1 Tax=Solibacillus sp. CAU 1738 TaxID=3140363 RepID=UPI00325FEDEE